MSSIKPVKWLLLLLVMFSLGGCISGSKVYKESSAIQQKLDQPYSTIYFLREELFLHHGPADDAVHIDINGHDIMKLAQGEYTMVRIKPVEGTVRVMSYGLVGSDPTIREMFGEETFNFAADQTNFIRIKQIDGEFRGIYYLPERIEYNRALKMAEELRPVGDAADFRIEDL